MHTLRLLIGSLLALLVGVALAGPYSSQDAYQAWRAAERAPLTTVFAHQDSYQHSYQAWRDAERLSFAMTAEMAPGEMSLDEAYQAWRGEERESYGIVTEQAYQQAVQLWLAAEHESYVPVLVAQQFVGCAIDDAGFAYYEHDHGYLTLTFEDGMLVYHLTEAEVPGAMVHNFSEIDKLSDARHELIWGELTGGESWHAQKHRQLTEQERLLNLAGFDVSEGLTVTHGDVAMNEIESFYVNAFTSWGFDATVEQKSVNVELLTFERDDYVAHLLMVCKGNDIEVRFIDL